MTFEEWAESIQLPGGNLETNRLIWGLLLAAWEAATLTEREACAKVCGDIGTDKYNLYKGYPPYTGAEEGRADCFVYGESCGADKCACAIVERSTK